MARKSRLFSHLYKIIHLFCIAAIFISVGCLSENNRAQAVQIDLLKKYKQQEDSGRQTVHVEEIAEKQLLVLDIQRSYLGVEPMDYTRIRIIALNDARPTPVTLFIKDDMAGVVINKCQCLTAPYKKKYANKYYAENANREIIFAEWPYGSGFGKVNVVKRENKEYFMVFSENNEIDWVNLDEDKQPEIVTYDKMEIAWEGRVFDRPFIKEDAYQYNEKLHKYKINPALSNIWIQIRLNDTLEKYTAQPNAGYFQRIIRYYLKLNHKKLALKFFDQDLNKIMRIEKIRLAKKDISNLREQINE